MERWGCLGDPQQFQGNDPHFVQHVQGDAHEHHIENIRGRGEKRCDDADNQGGIAAVFFKKRSGQNFYLGHENHKNGQFKDQPESENKNRDKGDKLADGDNRLELFRLEIKQEIDAERQGDEIAEGSPAVKKKAGKKNEPENKEPGQAERLGQGAPEKITEHGHDGENRHAQRDGDMGEEGLGHREKSELLMKMALDGVQQVGGNAVKAKTAQK